MQYIINLLLRTFLCNEIVFRKYLMKRCSEYLRQIVRQKNMLVDSHINDICMRQLWEYTRTYRHWNLLLIHVRRTVLLFQLSDWGEVK